MKACCFILIALLAGCAAKEPPPPAYDLVIRNGQVLDGSGKEGIITDVGIAKGKIVKIGAIQPGSGAKELVAQAMRDGAVGMSTGLIYPPGQFSSTEEIIELQKVAASFGGIYASHMRSEGTNILSAIDEALRVGREANCRVEISHFKLPSDAARKLGGSDVTLGRVRSAPAAGQEVWLDQYPYTASSTSINTMLPDWGY